ncbi:MAG: hypothetical protein NTV36_03270 [Candidatus Staskawiczbacteria bacterium]|nr:hypothetical protein [Candidatus Staskawiczbacteria bacterium]
MIFKILQIRKMASEAKDNPGKFAGGKAGEFFVDMLVMPTLILFVVLCSFFILGFTTFLGGPYVFFKVLFILLFLCVVCVLYFLRKIYKFIKSITENVVTSTLKVESTIVEERE